MCVLEKLEEFQKYGGSVIWCGDLPEMGVKRQEHELIRQKAGKFIQHEDVFSILKTILKDRLSVISERDTGCIFVSRYIKHMKDMYFILNTNKDDAEKTIDTGEVKVLSLYDPDTGDVEKILLPHRIVIKGNRSIFVKE